MAHMAVHPLTLCLELCLQLPRLHPGMLSVKCSWCMCMCMCMWLPKDLYAHCCAHPCTGCPAELSRMLSMDDSVRGARATLAKAYAVRWGSLYLSCFALSPCWACHVECNGFSHALVTHQHAWQQQDRMYCKLRPGQESTHTHGVVLVPR